MANEDQVNRLKQNVDGWNSWRLNNQEAYIDLFQAHLYKAHLNKANLAGADMEGANLIKADLRRTYLTGAKLEGAKLFQADMRGAKLTGAVIDSKTKLRGAKGITRGVNGIYSKGTKTAALMNMAPEGDSMQGSSVEAVLDNLKHVRWLHSISLLFAGVTLLSFVLHRQEIAIPFNIIKQPIGSVTFAGLSVIISGTLMLFVTIFCGSSLFRVGKGMSRVSCALSNVTSCYERPRPYSVSPGT